MRARKLVLIAANSFATSLLGVSTSESRLRFFFLAGVTVEALPGSLRVADVRVALSM